jgi:23S rRNA (pseudouridine1915-N3)-methyltransferase
MRIRLVSAGTRLPGWINEGHAGYAKRLSGYRYELIEVPTPRRSGGADIARAVATEGRRMLEIVGTRDYVVALEVTGRAMTTPEFARWLGARLADGRDLVFVIGGPDGLSPELLKRADFRWSLSQLTWPHGLARIMVVEQIYRAQSLLQGHPYHRA